MDSLIERNYREKRAATLEERAEERAEEMPETRAAPREGKARLGLFFPTPERLIVYII